MESRLLEYMLRVAELGSISKAAVDLQLSQPALSRHIAVLEEEMRTKLFTRTQGGVIPTEAGKLLIERARPLLQQLSQLKEDLGDAAAGQQSEIRAARFADAHDHGRGRGELPSVTLGVRTGGGALVRVLSRLEVGWLAGGVGQGHGIRAVGPMQPGAPVVDPTFEAHVRAAEPRHRCPQQRTGITL